MSGLKYSKIQIEKEIEAKQKAQDKIKHITANIQALKNKIKGILNAIPEGVRESFPDDINKIDSWLQRNIPKASEDWNSTQLNNFADELENIYKEGKDALNLSIEVKGEKRNKMASGLIGRIEDLKAQLDGMKTLLDKWEKGKYKETFEELSNLYQEVEKGDFPKVSNSLNSINEKIESLRKNITQYESEDNQREYVLNALRKTCKEMGWEESDKPQLENPNNPKSPIIYKVNTYSAGIITFYLTLEGIKANSQIPENTCYKDFDALSERLKKFGIKTEFERVEVHEEPKLIRKGELDLPDEGIEGELEQEV